MSKNERDCDKIEQAYLEMKEQDFEQVDMSELWSHIEERLDQSRKEEKKEKGKKTKRMGRKVVVCGTLAVAALLAIVSWSVMRDGNSLKNGSETSMDLCVSEDSENSQSSKKNGAQQNENNEAVSEKMETAEKYNDQTAKDSVSKSSAGQHDVISEKEIKPEEKSTSESITEEEEPVEWYLVYVKKQDGFYEFSVNLEKYDLQLEEISVKKEEDLLEVTYSDFSASVQEKLQTEIEDIRSYVFYVDSEGILYMEKADCYYQIHLEEKGDGSDGE